MRRGKQTILFVLCSMALVSVHVWANPYFATAEEILKEYAKTNHMGELQEVLLEKEERDGTLILGKADKGLVYISVKNTMGYSRKYEILKNNEGWAFTENGVAVKYVGSLDGVFGYAEQEEITKLICWTGENANTCEKMTLLSDEVGLFREAESKREIIKLSGSIWKPGGVHGWGFGERRIYAVEGQNEEGETVYWFSEYGFVKEDFAETGLTKKIYEKVVDIE